MIYYAIKRVFRIFYDYNSIENICSLIKTYPVYVAIHSCFTLLSNL